MLAKVCLIVASFIEEDLANSGVTQVPLLRDAVAVRGVVVVCALGPRQGAGEAEEEEEEGVSHDDGVVEVDDGRDGDHSVAHSLQTWKEFR